MNGRPLAFLAVMATCALPVAMAGAGPVWRGAGLPADGFGAGAPRDLLRVQADGGPALREQNRMAQAALNHFGYDVGTPDGVFGARSRAAISRFQALMGYPQTGTLTDSERSMLLDAFQRATGDAEAMQFAGRHPMGPRGVLLMERDMRAGLPGAGYGAGLPGAAPAPAPMPGFGAAPAPAPMPGFGAAPAPAPMPGFGAAPAPAPMPGFGAAPAPAPMPGFGAAPAPAPMPGFGAAPAPAPMPGFGAAPTPEPAAPILQQAAPLPSFGTPPAPQPASPLPSFGTPPAAEPAAAPQPAPQPAPAAPAPVLPNFFGAPQDRGSLADHCAKTNLLTNANGGFATADSMTDAVFALSEQFCLVRTFAISQGETMVARLPDTTPDMVTAQCKALGPSLQPHVAAVAAQDQAAVLQGISGFVVSTNMAPAQLSATARICLGSGYAADAADIAIGSALLLVALGEAAYAEVVAHHLALGFGVGAKPELALAWYGASLQSPELAATFAPAIPDRPALIRKAAATLAGRAP
jgi:peptidoglycan hydrolase-like protein with peptidoglycan-binding domain